MLKLRCKNFESDISPDFRLPYIEGFTNTSGGLRLMRTVQFTPGLGDRPDAPNVAVVITDATSNKDQNLTIPEALAAQAAGVTMFTIGFTNEMKVTKIMKKKKSERQKIVFVDLHTYLDQMYYYSKACESHRSGGLQGSSLIKGN